MAKETASQKATIERVMHAFKNGTLESGNGDPVRNRMQAIAIGLSEAGESNEATTAESRRNAERSRREQAGAARTKADLYAEAKRKGLPGRSTMTKTQLARALG